jgi:hypothetical protein
VSEMNQNQKMQEKGHELRAEVKKRKIELDE